MIRAEPRVTFVEGKNPNTAQIVSFQKRNDHSLQLSCIMNSGPLNIPSVWKVQVDWTPSNKLWRFSFIPPLQSSEMAYGSFI